MDVGVVMALARGLHLAATVSLLGTAGFMAWILPAAPVIPDRLRRRLVRLWWISGLVALLAGAAWFMLQSAAIAGAGDLSDLLDAVPVVAAHTRYGNVVMLRLALLVLATVSPVVVVWGGRWWRGSLYFTMVLTAGALSLQGLIGHAGATGGAIGDGLVASESLHLVAAGIWLGGLLPLWLSLLVLEPGQAVPVCERFSPIGLGCVVVLIGSGFAQASQLIGGLPALFGTAYGHVALVKIGLFLVALVLAAVNRLWLTDRLASGAGNARRDLMVSVGVETLVGLAIVGAAAFMASNPPAAHSTPVWPFSWQFSLVTVNEDAGFRAEVIISLVALGGAVALMVAALLWRRFRLLTLGLLVVVVVLRGPSLMLLTVEAYPTSFQTSPTAFSAVSIVRGQVLFGQNCVACHGPEGEGNGPASVGLRIKPADLTAPHIWEHTDGEMFWWLSKGIEDPEGGLAMPGFGDVLSADDRWALIDFIRAHNAGLAMQQDSGFDVPVRAPTFPVTCVGVEGSRMADLRGHVVHVVAGEAVDVQVPPVAGISTITLALRDTAAPAFGSCAAATHAAWVAYAVLTGLRPEALSGAEFLVDSNGWLRAVRRPGTEGAWHTGQGLIAAIQAICVSPIKQSIGGQHEHHH
jgi:putative copper export protein/mono/diheme cytochrome c family protein